MVPVSNMVKQNYFLISKGKNPRIKNFGGFSYKTETLTLYGTTFKKKETKLNFIT